ncbi:hypothetical protein NOK74_23970 [Vibrio parahaemolyticus]|uniref:hypothetical protein n=1 Tax=Vibrio parahaemolyticus TaxID=670 RepID=UPI00226AC079|nr:hypothetical protein [Vibrio parahaemolyticus]MCX8875264.1 hypothetical protein [Vibrio parahaemolyticus]
MAKDKDVLEQDEERNIKALTAANHQLSIAQAHLVDMRSSLKQVDDLLCEGDDLLSGLLDNADDLLSWCGTEPSEGLDTNYVDLDALLAGIEVELTASIGTLQPLDFVEVDSCTSEEEYMRQLDAYIERNQIQVDYQGLRGVMSQQQLAEAQREFRDSFFSKPAQCDSMDYMIAGTCGAIAGLVDVLFVGTPTTGPLTKVADDVAEGAVEKFASMLGWQGPRGDANSTSSAIGFLERKFKVNYDQATTNGERNGTGGKVKNLSTKNHHLKSLSHSPDIVGLFFSILNQFTNTSSFVSEGQIITIETEEFELVGHNFVAKIFAGVANWFGHIMSDVSGSSGIDRKQADYGRGSGVPVPFYNLTQLMNFGAFEVKTGNVKKGKEVINKQTLAIVFSKVFEQGYDLRHGAAMAIPVLISELLTRLSWAVKQHVLHDKSWEECIPKGSTPELRRMLLVSHGTLCTIDAADAALRSGSLIVEFFLRTNLVAWIRFGHLALKELQIILFDAQDNHAIDKAIEEDCKRLLLGA